MKQRRADPTGSADAAAAAAAADEDAGSVSVSRKRKKRRLILQEITDGPDGVLEKRSDVVRALQARRKAVRQPKLLPSQTIDVEVKPKVRVLSPTKHEMDKLSTQLSSAKLRDRPPTSYVGELVTKINGQKHGASLMSDRPAMRV